MNYTWIYVTQLSNAEPTAEVSGRKTKLVHVVQIAIYLHILGKRWIEDAPIPGEYEGAQRRGIFESYADIPVIHILQIEYRLAKGP